MSNNLLILSFSYFLIPISIIGYGILFQKFFLKKFDDYNFGYLGLFGVFFLIIYSYLSNFYISHSKFHNLIILIIGLFIFFYFFFEKKKKNIRKQTLILIISLLILFISILVYKNHDDFAYYHFPYAYLLTQHDLIIGLGNLGHGFRTHSSIFYLNSLFYIPFANHFLFNFGALLILCYSNIIIINKIFYKYGGLKVILNNRFFSLFGLFIFTFINIFFYRIAEHGTDRSAQILVLILFIEVIYFFNLKILSKSVLSKIYILLGLILSLKAFYFLYFIIFIPIIIHVFENKKNINKVLYFLLINKTFLSFSVLVFFVLLTNFFNTGCLIYPIHFTCFETISWSIPIQEVKDMNNWYELWSKAGAGTDFRVNDSANYIQNLNWLSNWFNLYFFNKVSDFLFGILFLISIFLIYFYQKKQKKTFKVKKLVSIYMIMIVLFFEWFYNHPALRYGGYALVYLFFIIPISDYLSSNYLKENNFLKKSVTVIFLTIIIFFVRNVDRLNDENIKYSYNPVNNTFYNINSNHFRIEKKLIDILSKNKLCENKKNVEDCLGETERISNLFNKIVIENKR